MPKYIVTEEGYNVDTYHIESDDGETAMSMASGGEYNLDPTYSDFQETTVNYTEVEDFKTLVGTVGHYKQHPDALFLTAPKWVKEISYNLNSGIYAEGWYIDERKALEELISDWGAAIPNEADGNWHNEEFYAGWEWKDGIR